MQIVINVPDKEFGIDIKDKFQDFFKRLEAETKEHLVTGTSLLCGAYELETIEMFLNAFKEMKIIPDGVTNGDIFLKTHPEVVATTINNEGELFNCVQLRNKKETIPFAEVYIDWWNAPYKGSVKKCR